MSSDVAPAYALWVELATRVTSQTLHYRNGDEEMAARSVTAVFSKARALLEQHVEAARFRTEALALLNLVLRPYTARWHGWMTEDKSRCDDHGRPALVFRDEMTRRMFRAELRQLQRELKPYKDRLAALAGVPDNEDVSRKATASLGAPIFAGIGKQIDVVDSPWLEGAKAFRTINQAERQELLARRTLLHGAPPADKVVNAVGLALSGGGIRSATYCLGIVQVLVRQNLFTQFDYLSTVSGGGYVGTFLSCALGTEPSAAAKKNVAAPPPPPTRQGALDRIEDVFRRQKSGTESGLIRHLRNNSKYLLNGGFMAKARIAGLVVSGILCNMLMVLWLPLAAALATFLFAKLWFWGSSLPVGSGIAPTDVWPTGDSPAGLSMLVMLLAAGAVLVILPIVQRMTHGSKPSSPGTWIHRVAVQVSLLIGIILVAVFAVYLLPILFHYYEALRAAFDQQGGLLDKLSEWSAPAAAGSASVALGVLASLLKSNWPRLRTFVSRLFILSGPVFFLFLYLMVGNRLGLGREPGPLDWNPWFIAGASAGLVLWSFFFVNINTLAPHLYYRAKLCECYLARRRSSPPAAAEADDAVAAPPARTPLRKLFTGEFAQNRTEALQQVPLTSLGANPAAPYHLINTTLNLPGSDNKELRGRDGDFFVVSKHYCGAPTVGYVATADLERKDPHFDLGTAMAVSAAAASSSMGWKSLPNFRFLMAILNVRLGYWLPWRSRSASPGAWYFLREIAASMNERTRFLNLSDGGHIENLAAYELLRRRCKFIVCVDGGMEPGMECADLTRLQRYAEIDLGIRFEYGIADLSLQPNGFSRASAILVKIIYPAKDGRPEALGWIVYMKLALLGIEPVYVLDYRRENPAFPHQSTADQLYDEAQFEAYRRLGECAAENLFRDELFAGGPPQTVEEWFQGLADNLLADNDPVFKTPAQAIAAAGPEST